jgi:hypothetical protein
MTASTLVWRCGAVALVVLCGCGGREPASQVAEAERWVEYAEPDRGYSVSFPRSWHRATERLSRITDPRELLSLATVRLRWQRTDCEAFAGAAGAGMSARDVVLTVWERGYDRGADWSDFPPRPRRFATTARGKPAGHGCGEPAGTTIYWRNFTDAGRHFHVLVRVGPDAPPREAAQTWRILDRLRLSGDYRPDWLASG